MKLTLTDGKPSSFHMNEDEICDIVVNHINKLLLEKFGDHAKVDASSLFIRCGYDGFDGITGNITTKPDTPVVSFIEL
jgi:hypothetical protein